MDLLDHDGMRLRRKHRTQHAEVLLNGGWIRSQAIERDQRRQCRKNGKQRKEGATRGHHGEIVAIAFAPHAFSNLPPTFERDVVRKGRVAAVGIWSEGHL